MDISKQALQLKKALNESRYTVAITGAGISFSAGGMQQKSFDKLRKYFQPGHRMRCFTKPGISSEPHDTYTKIVG